MLFDGLRRRREAAALPRAQVLTTADGLIVFSRGRLDRAFWSAHRRLFEGVSTPAERRFWRDVMDEIDARRPPSPPPRADTATRMVFRGLKL